MRDTLACAAAGGALAPGRPLIDELAATGREPVHPGLRSGLQYGSAVDPVDTVGRRAAVVAAVAVSESISFRKVSSVKNGSSKSSSDMVPSEDRAL